MTDKDEQIRLRVVKAMGLIGGTEGADAVMAALADPSELVRWAAAEQLGKVGDARAVPQLCELLRGGSGFVRKAVCEALGSLRDERAVEPLVSALRDDDAAVSVAAAKALHDIGGTRANVALREVSSRLVRALSEILWANGGPIETAVFDNEYEPWCALLQMAEFAKQENEQANSHVEKALDQAKKALTDEADFTRHRWYTRQIVAARILGWLGDVLCIAVLQKAKSLQPSGRRLASASVPTEVGGMSYHRGPVDQDDPGFSQIVVECIDDAIQRIESRQSKD
jgi:hypothetical protein